MGSVKDVAERVGDCDLGCGRVVAVNSDAQYVPHVAARLFGRPGWAWLPAAGGVAVIELVRAAREARNGHVERGLALAWLTLPLVIPLSWPHYFVFLPWVHAVQSRGLAAAGAGERTLWGLSVGFSSLAGLLAAGQWGV
jgi:hypothetical protein